MPDVSITLPYPSGYKNKPDSSSPLSAEAENQNDANLLIVLGQANAAMSAALGAQTYTDGATLTGVAPTATSDFTAQPSRLNPADATAGAITASLSSAIGNVRARVSLVKLDSSANAVIASGTINGVAGATYELLIQGATIDLVSDGSGSWWIAGGWGAPDLTATYATVSALNAMSDQQTALMLTAATIDQLAHGLHVPAGWTSGQVANLWPVPFACQVVSAQLMRVATDIAADASNYWQVQLQRVRAGATATIVQKRTSDEAETHLTNWSFDAATWDFAGAGTLAKGDAIAVVPSNAGTVTSTDRFGITLVVQPL